MEKRKVFITDDMRYNFLQFYNDYLHCYDGLPNEDVSLSDYPVRQYLADMIYDYFIERKDFLSYYYEKGDVR